MSIVVLYLIFVPLFICIPLILGVYTYRDARRRGMNAVLWALVAALAPTFLGFIIYLLVRGSYSDLTCAKCGGRIRQDYVVCPQCGVRLKATCAHCGAPIEGNWKVCPQCAQTLAWETQDFAPPVKPKDKHLWKILLLIILIPLLLLVVLGLSFSTYNSVGACHVVHYAEPDLILEAHELGIDLRSWRDMGRENEELLFVLASHQEGGDDLNRYNYLIYLPHAAEESLTKATKTGLLGTRVKVDYSTTAANEKGVFLAITIHAEKEPSLDISKRGEEMPLHFIHDHGLELSRLSGVEPMLEAAGEAAQETA